MCELSHVSFHGDTIFCVELNGEPYAPMRPIVENLGLEWGAQAVKLRANKERWGVLIIDTPSNGGTQETTCMPVRKLPAWLASINPKKVKPELRARIELYQNECDDALWDYWMKGKAERAPKAPASRFYRKREVPPYLEKLAQIHAVQLVNREPEERERVFNALRYRLWRKFHTATIYNIKPGQVAEAEALLAKPVLLGYFAPASQKERLSPAYGAAIREHDLQNIEDMILELKMIRQNCGERLAVHGDSLVSRQVNRDHSLHMAEYHLKQLVFDGLDQTQNALHAIICLRNAAN